MESSTALIIFFVNIFIGVIFFIIGAVLLFRKTNVVKWDEKAVTTARVIRLIPREVDWVAIIEYQVNSKKYYYSFRVLSEDTFPVGTAIRFYYDPNNPRRAQTGFISSSKSSRIAGITMVGIALIMIVVGTIVSYAMVAPEVQPQKPASMMNSIRNFFSGKK